VSAGFNATSLVFARFNILLPITAAMFDRQAEMSSLAIAPKVARVILLPAPSVLPVVSFAQALTASTKTTPNANLPKPTIIGETLSSPQI